MSTPYHNVRDAAGMFAPAASNGGGASFGGSTGGAPNGGGASFAPPADWGRTDSALLAHATSKPGSAPTMTGGNYTPPKPFDAHAALSAVTPGSDSLDQAAETLQDAGKEIAGSEDDEFHPAARAMGYGGGESAGTTPPSVFDHLAAAHGMMFGHLSPASGFGNANGGSFGSNGGGPDFGGVPGGV